MADAETGAPETGSTPRLDESEPVTYQNLAPARTAGEMRAAGYEIPSDVADDDIPGGYRADTPRTDPEPVLVRIEEKVVLEETPAEYAAKQPPAENAPEPPMLTLETTPAKAAGTPAGTPPTPPPAPTISETPAQAAGTPGAPETPESPAPVEPTPVEPPAPSGG